MPCFVTIVVDAPGKQHHRRAQQYEQDAMKAEGGDAGTAAQEAGQEDEEYAKEAKASGDQGEVGEQACHMLWYLYVKLAMRAADCFGPGGQLRTGKCEIRHKILYL